MLMWLVSLLTQVQVNCAVQTLLQVHAADPPFSASQNVVFTKAPEISAPQETGILA